MSNITPSDPVPRFPPLATDDQGRIIPVAEAEWLARWAAVEQSFKRSSERTDDAGDNGDDARPCQSDDAGR